MSKTLLLTKENGTLYLAFLEDGRLSELYAERANPDSLMRNIYLGRVTRVLPGLETAFVDIGQEKNGFLSMRDVPIPDAEDALRAFAGRQKPIKAHQELMVQVFKQPGGEKGVMLTGHIALPGRALVLLPALAHIGVSRKIEEEAERLRLRALCESMVPAGMGLIVRTAANGMTAADLEEEMGTLLSQWRGIERSARYAKSPALLYAPPGLAQNAARDMLLPDVEELVVDDSEIYAQIQGARIRFHASDTDLFTLYRVRSQAQKALERRVWLESGACVVFDRTEAMTVVDVNSGKYTGKRSLDDTLLEINREAAVEIARQLRLRDVGGIVVIDFIDMRPPEHKRMLLETLKEALKRDRSKTRLVGMTPLGLVELTRKKVSPENALFSLKNSRVEKENP